MARHIHHQNPDGKYVHACLDCKFAITDEYPFAVFRCKCPGQLVFHSPVKTVKKKTAPPPKKEYRDHLKCEHLLDIVRGFNATQTNCGCQGSKLTSVWECELHKLCAPFSKSDVEESPHVHPCILCKEYTRDENL